MAQGSLFELKTQLIVTRKLGFAGAAELNEPEKLCEEVSKMLVSLINKLRPAKKVASRGLKADG